MQLKNIHEKLTVAIQKMLIDISVNLPYYGHFNLFISFHERENIQTCGVNMTPSGMNFYYSSSFLNRLSQKEVNFIVLHEDFHLLWSHPKRTISGAYDHKLSNIAQDMIINHIIWSDIPTNYVEIPKDENGRNMALFIPKGYLEAGGKLIFEHVYEYLRDEKEKHDKENKEKKKCSTCNGTGKSPDCKQPGKGPKPEQGESNKEGDSGHGEGGSQPCPDCKGTGSKDGKDSSGKPSYGPYGSDPKNDKGTIDTWSLDEIFDKFDSNEGQYLDVHLGDEIPEEMRDAIIKDKMETLKARGYEAGNIETTLGKLRKKRKDYLREIKRSIANEIMGNKKQKTITKPNRRQIVGMKGNKKVKTKIAVILDTSGSMGNTFDKVLSYIYRNDIEVVLIQGDTVVQDVGKIRNKNQLAKTVIRGLGGTCLNPSIKYVVDNHNDLNLCILSDGFTDNLELKQIKNKVLIISIAQPCPIATTNNKVKQIVVDLEAND